MCDGALHMEQHHMYAGAGGDCHHPPADAAHLEDPGCPRRLGGTDKQSLHRRPGQLARQASLPRGGTRRVPLDMTNPPQDRPRALRNSMTRWSPVPFTEENGLKL